MGGTWRIWQLCWVLKPKQDVRNGYFEMEIWVYKAEELIWTKASGYLVCNLHRWARKSKFWGQLLSEAWGRWWLGPVFRGCCGNLVLFNRKKRNTTWNLIKSNELWLKAFIPVNKKSEWIGKEFNSEELRETLGSNLGEMNASRRSSACINSTTLS